MRSLRFLPLAFIAAEHGFLFFAPYAAAVLVGVHAYERVRRTRRGSFAALSA